jgi:hypothetical protein
LRDRGQEDGAGSAALVATYTDQLCVCCGETAKWPLRGYRGMEVRCDECRRVCYRGRDGPCLRDGKVSEETDGIGWRQERIAALQHEERDGLFKLRQEGLTYAAIGKRAGVSRQRIHQLIGSVPRGKS